MWVHLRKANLAELLSLREFVKRMSAIAFSACKHRTFLRRHWYNAVQMKVTQQVAFLSSYEIRVFQTSLKERCVVNIGYVVRSRPTYSCIIRASLYYQTHIGYMYDVHSLLSSICRSSKELERAQMRKPDFGLQSSILRTRIVTLWTLTNVTLQCRKFTFMSKVIPRSL